MKKKIIYVILTLLFITSCNSNNLLDDNGKTPKTGNHNNASLDDENSFIKEVTYPPENTNFNINKNLGEK